MVELVGAKVREVEIRDLQRMDESLFEVVALVVRGDTYFNGNGG